MATFTQAYTVKYEDDSISAENFISISLLPDEGLPGDPYVAVRHAIVTITGTPEPVGVDTEGYEMSVGMVTHIYWNPATKQLCATFEDMVNPGVSCDNGKSGNYVYADSLEEFVAQYFSNIGLGDQGFCW
jgi:hypothetical protein